MNDKSCKQAYKKIGSVQSPAVISLKDQDGNITARPHEIDAILQRAWHQVYRGNVTQIAPS
eukprot:12422980-Karenia_brevis.AAC.1